MNDEIYGAFPYYRELAHYIKRLEEYERGNPNSLKVAKFIY